MIKLGFNAYSMISLGLPGTSHVAQVCLHHKSYQTDFRVMLVIELVGN